MLTIWTEIVRPLTEAIGSAMIAYPWLIVIPAAILVTAAFALRQELDQ